MRAVRGRGTIVTNPVNPGIPTRKAGFGYRRDHGAGGLPHTALPIWAVDATYEGGTIDGQPSHAALDGFSPPRWITSAARRRQADGQATLLQAPLEGSLRHIARLSLWEDDEPMAASTASPFNSCTQWLGKDYEESRLDDRQQAIKSVA